MNKTRHLLTFFYLILVPLFALGQKSSSEKPRFVLAIHGGAVAILKEKMTDSLELAYRETLEHALRIGYDAISQGKSSLDAVELTIQVFEGSPCSTPGKGAVFLRTRDTTNWMRPLWRALLEMRVQSRECARSNIRLALRALSWKNQRMSC